MLLDLLQSGEEALRQYFEHTPLNILVCLLTLVGACIGSFLNVVIYRSPLSALKHEQDYVSENYGVTIPDEAKVNDRCDSTRSYCPSCNVQIPWYLNLPIIGWLMLRGKARCCGVSISPIYPFSELLIAFAFGWVTAKIGEVNFTLITLLAVLCIGYVIMVIDLKTKLIMDHHSIYLVVSFVLCTYTITKESDLFILALVALSAIYVVEKSYEFTRNKLMNTNLVMMGEGDWALWYLFCVACSAHMHVVGSTWTVFAEGIIYVTITMAVVSLYRAFVLKKEDAYICPAAPAIIGTSIALLIMTMERIPTLFS